MYSRYHDRPERPVTLPENYSGCAFSAYRDTKNDAASHRIDVAKPTPPPEAVATNMPPPPRPVLLPPAERPATEPPKKDPPPPAPCEEATAHPAPKASLHGLFDNLGRAFPLSHGFGFDEILIIGLIFLLANNDRDSDLILWLALLLFCG